MQGQGPPDRQRTATSERPFSFSVSSCREERAVAQTQAKHCWLQVPFAAGCLALSHPGTWLYATFLGLDGTFPSWEIWVLGVAHDLRHRPELKLRGQEKMK